TKTANTSPVSTLNAASFVKLQLLVPGGTAAPGTSSGKTGTPNAATAGTAFTVTVNAVDTNWNVVSTVSDNVGITSSDSNAALPANSTLSSGTKTFSVTLKTAGSATVTASSASISDDNGATAGNLTLASGTGHLASFTFKSAGTQTITASDSAGALQSATSAGVTVGVGSFAKLQLLVPGETASPGSASGKTGTPTSQISGNQFSVTVNSVDANWNLISTNDTVKI